MSISVLDTYLGSTSRDVTSDLVNAEQLPCRREDPELWFAETPADVELAKALCVDCPVRRECLAGALERREPWGVWGGQLFLQGVVIPRKRPRGRPRKNEVAA
jgi:WhiB family redox-sensing transcriptional regulator